MLMYVISVLWEVEAGGSGVQGYPCLHSLSQKNKTKNRKKKVTIKTEK